MRLNRYLALGTGYSRRHADTLITEGRVTVNGAKAVLGQTIEQEQIVKLNDKRITPPQEHITLILNKPIGIVVSRTGQGSKTIYQILPKEYSNLKPVGRIDKDSSGLLLLTTDGKLANTLSHPTNKKQKIYHIKLDNPLANSDERKICAQGVTLEDGLSKFKLEQLSNDKQQFIVTMSEGRNRQIRRTFACLGYQVQKLERKQFGEYKLGDLAPGEFKLA